MEGRKGLIRVTTPEGTTAYAGQEQLESLQKKGWKVGKAGGKKVTAAQGETLKKEAAAREAEITETKKDDIGAAMKKVKDSIEGGTKNK